MEKKIIFLKPKQLESNAINVTLPQCVLFPKISTFVANKINKLDIFF